MTRQVIENLEKEKKSYLLTARERGERKTWNI